MSEFAGIAERYIALWNEPDEQRRRAGIAELWAEDCLHFTPSREVRGQAAMAVRIAESHDRWVRDAGRIFRPAGDADGHHGAVRFHWQMVPAGGGPVEALGFDILMLGPDGRIRSDHQFIEPTPA